MHSRPIRNLGRILIAGCALGMGATLLMAQNSSSAPAASTATADSTASRMDVFLGYSYLAPHGTVTETLGDGTTFSNSYSSINAGAIGSFAYYFNRYVGGQIEYANHPDGNNDGAQDIGGGIIFRYPLQAMTPFLHATAGAVRLGGPNDPAEGSWHPYTWGPALTVGGGLDYELPFWNHRFALRLFQVDYQYYHADFGPSAEPTGGRANVNAARLSTGLVMHFGTLVPPPPVAYSCSVSPDSVYPGEQVTVTGTATNLDPKKKTTYSWSGQGLTVGGTSSTTTIDTNSLQPGNYTVGGHVTEGNKAGQSADCTAQFTVKQFEPPTISCTANPTTVNPGESSTITCNGVSPQNRPLTYSYSASAGSINGTGTTATLSTAGAPTGTITVTGTVQDDKGQSASATTTVDVQAPPPPPAPTPSPEQVRLEQRLALHSVFFPTNEPSPRYPDRGLLESQRQTLRTLATDLKSYLAIKPDATITLTGHADVRGSAKYNDALTERRASIVKQFLMDQGIPGTAIDTQALGKSEQLSREQVKTLVDENPDLSPSDKREMDRRLSVIYLAQNRRVDITLNNTGQKSVKLYPFNAADSKTLLSVQAPKRKGKAIRKP